ncbi:MAG TPA: hypothetical protein VHN98_08010 [Acidimicrobiales bacterium]|nr:hypothetical protein [Acidimicrobiales bacterium]
MKPETAPGAAVDATAGRVASLAFGALSALRGRRVFHPKGVARLATFDTTDFAARGRWGAALLDEAARRRAVVRVSRGIGLPEPLPDVLGVAIRVEDAPGGVDHDILMVTAAGRAPLVRRLLVPALRPVARPYSTLTPYQTGTGLHILLGAHIASPDRIVVEAARIGGPWEPVATVDLGAALTEDAARDLELNPFHSTADLRPVGIVNALRHRAYHGSQVGRALVRR